jgi:hypothetical protein
MKRELVIKNLVKTVLMVKFILIHKLKKKPRKFLSLYNLIKLIDFILKF